MAKYQKSRDGSYANHLRRAKRRNAKIQAGEYGKFKRIEIFERDKWICKLCGNKVDKKEKYPLPGSATIDHIVPIACGGLHTRENTQLAHNKCNYTKQHTGFGGQLWLIG
jgi:5-methylcytosine-specific restriction endonuclease McrA